MLFFFFFRILQMNLFLQYTTINGNTVSTIYFIQFISQ